MHDEFMAQLNGKLSARSRQADAPVAQVFTRKQIEQAFIESFELVGGVPRLALWANEKGNYGDFLSLLIKLAPKDMGEKEHGKTFEYRSNIPPSPLNNGPAGLEQITEAVFTEVEHVDRGVSRQAGGVSHEGDEFTPGGEEAVLYASPRG